MPPLVSNYVTDHHKDTSKLVFLHNSTLFALLQPQRQFRKIYELLTRTVHFQVWPAYSQDTVTVPTDFPVILLPLMVT